MAFNLDDLKKELKTTINGAFADKWEENRAKALEKQQQQHMIVGDNKNAPSKFQKGNELGRIIRYLAAAHNDVERAIGYAKKHGDEDVVKVMGTDTLSGGGAMVEGDFANNVIDVLRARSIVRKLGAPSVPMNGGSLTMPYGDTGTTAYYSEENANATMTTPEMGQLVLTAKKLVTLTALSNDLIKDTSGRADSFIKNDVANAMAVREDAAFIRDDGTQNKPKGIRYWAADVSNTTATSGTSIANKTTDLMTAILHVENDNVPITNGAWMFAPRTNAALLSQRDSNGNLAFAPEMATGTLFGYKFGVTTSIPITLNTDKSELYFVNMDSCIIAESDSLEIEVFPGGAYYNNSSVISGISQDQTVVRAISRHDFGCRYRGMEAGVITGLAWTP